MIAIAILSLLGILILFLGFSVPRTTLIPLTVISCVAALGGVFYELSHGQELAASLYDQPFMNGMMAMTQPAAIFSAIIITCGMLVVPFAKSFEDQEHAQLAEFCALVLFAMAGGVMMVSYQNLIMLFIGVEILSISIYILTGSDKRNVRSNEAAIKYFLMGSFATAILLFGFAMIYGSTGSFYLKDMAGPDLLTNFDLPIELRYLGMTMVIIGILFKVSAAPFHFWTADVYEGAPTVFTAFMSTVVKTAGFAALILFLNAFASEADHSYWSSILAVSTALTLFAGNILALVQSSYKRMLAYSSISHAGFMLIAVYAYSADTLDNILFYSLSYGLATVAAFGVYIAAVQRRGGEGMEPLRGLGKDEPVLAFVLTVALASLGGIPLTAGFIGKLYVFANAVAQPGTMPVLIIAIIMSMISVYYYFRVIATMYMSDRTSADRIRLSFGQTAVLFVATAATLVLGLAPGLLNFFAID